MADVELSASVLSVKSESVATVTLSMVMLTPRGVKLPVVSAVSPVAMAALSGVVTILLAFSVVMVTASVVVLNVSTLACVVVMPVGSVVMVTVSIVTAVVVAVSASVLPLSAVVSSVVHSVVVVVVVASVVLTGQGTVGKGDDRAGRVVLSKADGHSEVESLKFKICRVNCRLIIIEVKNS